MSKIFKKDFLDSYNYEQNTYDWGMNCKTYGIQSPIDIPVSKNNFNRTMFESNLKMFYNQIDDNLKFRWKFNNGFYIDNIKDGKDRLVYDDLKLIDNLISDK